MAFVRWETIRTMASRVNSTEALGRGLSHILDDLTTNMPEDLDKLQELEQQLADLEALDSAANSESQLKALQQVASPQESLAMAETIPATDSQLMDVVNGSPGSGGDQSNATSSPTSPVPSQASTSSKGPTDEVTLRIVAMMQNGELDPAIAMQLLGQGMTAAAPEGDASDPKNDKKRPLDTTGESHNPSDVQDIDGFLQEAKKVKLEENALKQKLRRLCEPKKGGRLQVPQWLHDEWRTGDHLVMAKQYEACNFNKDAFIKYKEKRVTKTDRKTNDELFGWYSKDAMSKILKWTTKKINGAVKCCEAGGEKLVRRCKYGGEDEYYITVSETGCHKEEHDTTEQSVERTQEDGPAVLRDVNLGRLNGDAARAKVAASAAVATTSEANRGKDMYVKYIDSVLQKSAKIRSLIGDLQKNYPQDQTAMKACTTMNTDLATLDAEYNKLAQILAEGERDNFNQEWLAKAEKAMKDSTFVCTKVASNEAKIRSAKRHFKKKEVEAKVEQ